MSSICALALATAAAWLLSPPLVIVEWQNAPYRWPYATVWVSPGAGVMLRPTENGLPSDANGSEPSLLPVHSDGEQLAVEISTRDRLCWPTQSADATPLML